MEQAQVFQTISIEEADKLVLEHRGWAESVARAVARGWNMDWELDGLDGAAMEALVYCSRRFQPGRGVPFRGYARKRIHEAATDAARKSLMWKNGDRGDVMAREISAELLRLFPEMRDGVLPTGDDGGDGEGDDARSGIRRLIFGASLIAARQEINLAEPEQAMDFKRLIQSMSNLEPVHQSIMWKVYWEGISLRQVAEEWKIDELNIVREHKALIDHLQTALSAKSRGTMKVRPGLRQVAMKMKKKAVVGEFSKFVGAAGKKAGR